MLLNVDLLDVNHESYTIISILYIIIVYTYKLLLQREIGAIAPALTIAAITYFLAI